MAGVAAGAIVGALTATGSAMAQHQTAKKSRRMQMDANRKAEDQAVSTKRQNAVNQKRANKKRPDIGAIMAANRGGSGGIGSTNLTGGGGIGTQSIGGSTNMGGY